MAIQQRCVRAYNATIRAPESLPPMSRFTEPQAAVFQALTSYVAFDERLCPQGLVGSRARGARHHLLRGARRVARLYQRRRAAPMKAGCLRRLSCAVSLAAMASGCGAAGTATTPMAATTAPPVSTAASTKTSAAPRSRRGGSFSVTRFSFASAPIVLFTRDGGGSDSNPNYSFRVLFKTDRRLPETSRANARARVYVAGFGDPLPPGRFSRNRPCYDQELLDGLTRPVDGQRVSVEVRLKRRAEVKATTSVNMRRVSSKAFRKPSARIVAEIGCAGERPRE